MTAELLQPSLEDRQRTLEAEMRATGLRRLEEALQAAKGHDRETSTTYGKNLLAGSIQPIVDGIKTFMKEVKEDGRAARLSIASRYLELIEPEVAAFMAAKVIINAISRAQRLQSAAVRIGHMIEDEVRFRAFDEAKATDQTTGKEYSLKFFADKVVERINKESSDYRYKRNVLAAAMRKVGVEWKEWPEKDCCHLGVKLIEIVEATTGIVAHVEVTNRTRRSVILTATESTMAWIEKASSRDAFNAALYLPMLVTPRRWEGPMGGGYLGGEGNPLSRMKLVKTRNKAYLEELRSSSDMPTVLSALNTIQETAWQVNRKVLGVMSELWFNSNSEIGKLPARENEPQPTKPVDIATNMEARKKWRKDASKAIKQNIERSSRRLQVFQVLKLAQRFAPEEAIYFPYNLDFRGRLYAIPAGLTPQGNDISKGLLTFAKGKPLGDERAAEWLAIHGANLFGYDKVNLADRVKWVRDNQKAILQCAQEPLDCLWWGKADKPWQFLAFCFEWAGYVEEGLSFVSHLPIALDGSCNGLQHFSAMLRDPVGGAAVNLIPGDRPNDIYGVVAQKTVEKLVASNDEMATQWLAFGINRKTAKRPVMVVPYGGTRFSARSYIEAHLKERVEEGAVCPWGDDKKAIFKATKFLAGFLWEAIRETVIAARAAMDWLQKVSQVVSKHNVPITWTAPSGFKVQQWYPNVRKRLVETKIAGQVMQLFLDEEGEGLDKRRQAQGISPNFVHSLDASALMFTVEAASMCGIENFAMIHDSYGTLAADTDVLRECLRQAFCQMYQFDVLAAFRDEIQKGLPEGVELPPLPKKGSLDINLVLQSDFFFA